MTSPSKKIAILIVAGGSGSRMNADLPKQYLALHGKMILRHTIEKFLDIGTVQCVIGDGHEALYQQAVEGLSLRPQVSGGTTRQESVRLGLLALEKENSDFVFIHDAARPCLYPEDINNLINSLDRSKGITLAIPVSESLQRDGEVIDRENLWMIQTPQVFPFEKILDCHLRAEKDGLTATDDTAIYRHYGHIVDYVQCGRHNIKITTQDDLKMIQHILQKPLEYRTGMGFDVHAFDTSYDASMIRLGGIDIPHHRTLKGHSDADVGLHALTDAILGAIADGDIGTHFPPSDENFKNMDSHIFLDKAVDLLKTKDGSLTHIDLTYICEEPKIGKHRTAMQRHLSDYLKLSTGRISIKATTSEQLGFTGRREGIACQAVVTIQVPADD